jgi:hypothetical protein
MSGGDALAIATAILYAARLQRRLPENDRQKRDAIAESLADARLILGAVAEADKAEKAGNAFPALPAPAGPLNAVQKTVMVPAPEQPHPSPGLIGRKAEAKAARRRG